MKQRQLRFVVLLIPVVTLIVVTSICSLSAQTAAPAQVEITAESGHHLVLENEHVRVFKVEVAPNGATLMHHHGHDYIYVALGISQVENDVAGKPPVKLTLQDGETHFVPGGFAHIAKNLSDRPFHNITIELMDDEKARQSPPPKWGVNGDDERGLQILSGGTRDILFVKDGVRASELDLQPGGVVPKHHDAGPQLVVAVTDLDLRSDIEDKAPAQVQLKAGDVAWAKGGATTHALTNVGTKPAKLITIEFH